MTRTRPSTAYVREHVRPCSEAGSPKNGKPASSAYDIQCFNIVRHTGPDGAEVLGVKQLRPAGAEVLGVKQLRPAGPPAKKGRRASALLLAVAATALVAGVVTGMASARLEHVLAVAAPAAAECVDGPATAATPAATWWATPGLLVQAAVTPSPPSFSLFAASPSTADFPQLWTGLSVRVRGWAGRLAGQAGRIGGGGPSLPLAAGHAEATAPAPPPARRSSAWEGATHDVAARTCMATCMSGAAGAASAPTAAAAGAAMQSAVFRAAGFEAVVGRGGVKVVAGAVRALASIHVRAAVSAAQAATTTAAAAWADSAAAVEAAAAVAGPVVVDAAHAAATVAVSAWEVGVPVVRAAWSATTAAADALASAAKVAALTILEPPGSTSFELNAIRARWPAGGEHAGTPVGQFVERLIADQLAARAVRRAVVKEVAALAGLACVGVALFGFTHALEKKRVWAWRLDGAVRRRLRLCPVKHVRAHPLLCPDGVGLGLSSGKLVGIIFIAFVAAWCSTGLVALAPPRPQMVCMTRRRV